MTEGGAPSNADAHHAAGAPAGAKARSGLEFAQTHPAAAGAAVENPAWPGAGGDVSAGLPAWRDRLLRFHQGETGGDHPSW